MSLIRKFDLKNAKKAGVDVLLVAGGFVAAYQLTKLDKKNTLLVNLGVTALGAAAAVFANNQIAQLVGVVVGGYGIVKVANNLSADVITFHGLGEDAPPPVTNKISAGFRAGMVKVFPTLQGEADYTGSANDNMLDEPAQEIRAINGFENIISGAEIQMSGVPTNLMIS